MKIVYNPKDGAPISRFIFKGVMLDLHPVGELKQYDDLTADALIENYEFLEIVTPDQAKDILSKPKPAQYKCQYCEKEFTEKIALTGHMRSHKDEIRKDGDPQVDESLIPVANGKKVIGQSEMKKIEDDYSIKGEIPNGSDADGVSWYGEGLTEEKGSLSKITPIGQRGHFGA